MGDETDRTDRRIRNGLGHFGPGVRCECPTKIDLGVNGETCAAMVSDSSKDGESAEDHPYGVAIGGDRGY